MPSSPNPTNQRRCCCNGCRARARITDFEERLQAQDTKPLFDEAAAARPASSIDAGRMLGPKREVEKAERMGFVKEEKSRAGDNLGDCCAREMTPARDCYTQFQDFFNRTRLCAR